MNEQKYFQEIKTLFIESKYPNANHMNDDDIKLIITPENRINFLMSVFMQLEDEETFSDLEKNKNKQNNLGLWLFNHGFCRKKENEKFVSGSELNFSSQMPIFRRIFEKLRIINSLEENSENIPRSCEKSTEIQNIDLHLRKDVNILPPHIMFPTKNYFENRTGNIDLYKRNIEKLKQDRDNLKEKLEILENEQLTNNITSNIQSDDLIIRLENTNETFLKDYEIFESKSGNWSEQTNETEEIIKNLDKNLKIIAKLPVVYDNIEKLKDISEKKCATVSSDTRKLINEQSKVADEMINAISNMP